MSMGEMHVCKTDAQDVARNNVRPFTLTEWVHGFVANRLFGSPIVGLTLARLNEGAS